MIIQIGDDGGNYTLFIADHIIPGRRRKGGVWMAKETWQFMWEVYPEHMVFFVPTGNGRSYKPLDGLYLYMWLPE